MKLYANLIKTFLEGIGSNLGRSHIPEILLREMLLNWFQSKYILLFDFSKTEKSWVQIPAKGITHAGVLLSLSDLMY